MLETRLSTMDELPYIYLNTLPRHSRGLSEATIGVDANGKGIPRDVPDLWCLRPKVGNELVLDSRKNGKRQ